MRREPVGAHQEQIARQRGELGEVRLDRASHADRPSQDVAVRMIARRRFVDLTAAQQLSDE